MESVINNLSEEKDQTQTVSLANSTKHLKNKLCQFFTISSRKQKHREHFLNHSLKTMLVPKEDKDKN